MIGAAEDGADLVKQSGLDADKPVLGAPAKLCDLHGWQVRPEKFQEKKSGRDFERGGTGKAATGRQIALDFRREPFDRKPRVDQFPNDTERVVGPAGRLLQLEVAGPDLEFA